MQRGLLCQIGVLAFSDPRRRVRVVLLQDAQRLRLPASSPAASSRHCPGSPQHLQIPAGGSTDAAQISAWVQAHFTAQSVGGMTVYNLTVPAASS
jgi:hypothetical protein